MNSVIILQLSRKIWFLITLIVVFFLFGHVENVLADKVVEKPLPVPNDIRNIWKDSNSQVVEIYTRYQVAMADGDFNSAEAQLNMLSTQKDDISALILLYERINLHLKGRDYDRFLQVLIENKDDSLTDNIGEEIQVVLVQALAESTDLAYLQPILTQIASLFPDWMKNPDILKIFKQAFSDDLNNDYYSLLYWVYADISESEGKDKRLIEKIKRNPGNYANEVNQHFKRQYALRNYTYLNKTIPEFRNLLFLEGEDLDDLQFIYIQSLIRKRQYSFLLDKLGSETFKKTWGLTDYHARKERARLLIRKGNPNQAVNEIRYLEKNFPKNNFIVLYIELADYYERKEELEKAVRLYEKIREHDISVSYLETIQWKIAWLSKRLRDKTRQASVYTWANGHIFEDAGTAAKFCYWEKKITKAPVNELVECYQKFPTTYYGYRSYTVAKATDNQSNNANFGRLSQLPELGNDHKEFLQLLDLVYQYGHMGLGDLLTRRYLAKHQDLHFFLYLSGILYEWERYYLQQLMVEIYFKERSREREVYGNSLLAVAFPFGYPDVVDKHIDRSVVPDSLLLAVIREESNFRPEVKSVAGASGLMQLMPATAKYVGKLVKVKVPLEDLTNPELNIQLGAAYLRRLLKRYDGSMYYALAAYNGGPTNVKKWRRKLGTDDMDVFVESIPFEETKNYVKRVLRSYFVYKQLYG